MQDEVVGLQAEVARQRARIEDQHRQIDELRAAVEDLRRHRPPPAPAPAPGHPPGGEATDTARPPDATDRRHVLAEAAKVAAGAVVGGTALALTQGSPAAAVSGTFDGDPAITASANPGSGIGVIATTTTGFALRGEATSAGVAVYGRNLPGSAIVGFTEGGVGAVGSATTGVGVQGVTDGPGIALRTSVNDVAATHLAFAGVNVLPAPPPSSAVSRDVGSVVFDDNFDLWSCVGSGTPGQWRKLSGPTTAGSFHALETPVRVYDSRPGNPPSTGPKTPLGGGTSRTVDTTGNASGVPAGATAVLVNLTVVNTSASGFLALYTNGIAYPGTSSINWDHTGQIVANTTITAVDGNGLCRAYVPVSSQCDFLLDVLGYYR